MTRRIAILAIGLLAWTVSAPAEADSCAACHATRAEARLRAPVDSLRDAHGRAQIGCASCHRGEPSEPSARAHDLASGFVGRPDPLGVLRMCRSCHDGSHDGAPPVVSEYEEGAHYRALAEGRYAADCSGCHVPHDIEALTPSTAQARCVACHANAARMRASGLPTDQADQWSASVHGTAPDGSGAPRCADCHDAHRNRSGLAATGSCGGCHDEIREAFDAGPHAAAFERLGFLDCVECHGSHEIAAPRGGMLRGLDAVCARCHGPGQPAFDRVRSLSSQAEGVDRARAAGRDDPTRRAVARAVHAIDPEGLRQAVSSLGDPPPRPSPPSASDPGDASWLGFAVLVALAGLGAWVWARRRRR